QIAQTRRIARHRAMALAVATFIGTFGAASVYAQCPTVTDPQNLNGAWAGQVEVEEALAADVKLSYSENPLFADDVKAGKLPPVAERLPEEPLIVLPYVECGAYGGTLNGLARAPESGTSDILSWRQVSLVRIGDDLQTIVPNVAKAWTWADDYKSVEFTL